MWFARLLCLFALVVTVAGCGGEVGSTVEDAVPDPVQSDIRPGLASIAQTGSLDTLSDIREATEYGLKPIDAAKAETLLQQLDELKGASSREAAKAKAAEILSQR